MKVILNLTADTAAVPALIRLRPPAFLPFLGQTVLEQALMGLAMQGVKNVQIAAGGLEEPVRNLVARGEAWGLDIEIMGSVAPPDGVALARAVWLDSLPQLPEHALWSSYQAWHDAQQKLIPVMARQRVGMREIRPGVFAGLRSQVAPDATLEGPCWIGAQVCIASGAAIGPGTIIGDRSYIDEGAEIVGSIVGPQTYVGAFTEVRDSFAWGHHLLHLVTGSTVKVADPFLLAEMRGRKRLAAALANFLPFRLLGRPPETETSNFRLLPGD